MTDSEMSEPHDTPQTPGSSRAPDTPAPQTTATGARTGGAGTWGTSAFIPQVDLSAGARATRRQQWFVMLMVALGFALLYGVTAAPAITPGQSGAATLAALGVAPPPRLADQNPVYAALARGLAALGDPAGTLAYANAFLGALALGLLALAALGVSRSVPAALIGALVVGLSRAVWATSAMPGPAPLGLVLLAGGLALALAASGRHPGGSGADAERRAAPARAILWRRIVAVVLFGAFGAYTLLSPAPRLIGAPTQAGGFGVLRGFGTLLQDAGIAGALLGALGLVGMLAVSWWRRAAALALGGLVAFVVVVTFGTEADQEFAANALHLSYALAAGAMLLGLGAAPAVRWLLALATTLARQASMAGDALTSGDAPSVAGTAPPETPAVAGQATPRWLPHAVVGLLALLVVLSGVLTSGESASKLGWYDSDDYATNVLATLPPGAVVVAAMEHHYTPIRYRQQALAERPDVEVLGRAAQGAGAVAARAGRIQSWLARGRPVFATIPDPEAPAGTLVVPFGLVYELRAPEPDRPAPGPEAPAEPAAEPPAGQAPPGAAGGSPEDPEAARRREATRRRVRKGLSYWRDYRWHRPVGLGAPAGASAYARAYDTDLALVRGIAELYLLPWPPPPQSADDALRYFRQIDARAIRGEALGYVGRLLLQRFQQLQAARVFLDRAYAVGPPDLPTWVDTAKLREYAGEKESAHAVWEAIVARWPEQPEAWIELAWLRLRIGATEQAAIALEHAEALDVNDGVRAAILEARGLIAARQIGSEAAIALWKEALRLDPGRVGARRLLDQARGTPRRDRAPDNAPSDNTPSDNAPADNAPAPANQAPAPAPASGNAGE